MIIKLMLNPHVATTSLGYADVSTNQQVMTPFFIYLKTWLASSSTNVIGTFSAWKHREVIEGGENKVHLSARVSLFTHQSASAS